MNNIWRVFQRYRMLKINTVLFFLVFLANALLFAFFVFPEGAKKNQALQKWEASRENLNRLHSLKKAETQLMQWRGLLKPKGDFSDINSAIYKTAKKNRIEIPSIDYQQEELDLKGLSKISFSFTVTNRYDRIRKFIYALETSSEFLLIDQLVVRKFGKKGSKDVEAQMKVSAFLIG